jgi:hypothetical protein
MKGSHQLTLKNELILSMIEKNSEWERILTENIIQFDEEVRIYLRSRVNESLDLGNELIDTVSIQFKRSDVLCI